MSSSIPAPDPGPRPTPGMGAVPAPTGPPAPKPPTPQILTTQPPIEQSGNGRQPGSTTGASDVSESGDAGVDQILRDLNPVEHQLATASDESPSTTVALDGVLESLTRAQKGLADRLSALD